MDEPVIAAQDVDFSYYNGLVLRDVTLNLATGAMVSLIGPNGSGKTTLLKILCGLLKPKRGRVLLSGQDIDRLSRREVAQEVALVPQELSVPFDFTVREMVMLGRTPYVRHLRGMTPQDHQVVDRMLTLTNTSALAQRPFNELSGGEQQRVIIAMALAQEPRVLLLDEPVVHLDVNHQIEILELIRRLNRQAGLTVLATMHDLNLASLYFDRLVLLNEGRVVTSGAPGEVLREDTIRRVFRADVRIQPHPVRPRPQLVLLPPSA
ncbi:MAG: heme ABC transporter ATP-binding protein [Chloroflexi bacterium]|nr:heme ABC transporter ATP-binding protein [Chloroflexota bacterium]